MMALFHDSTVFHSDNVHYSDEDETRLHTKISVFYGLKNKRMTFNKPTQESFCF